jgi:arylsulfatase
MVYTFNDPNDKEQKPLHDLHAETRKTRQYYAMLGTRGIWEDGWKVASLHAPLSGMGKFDKDTWELYHVDEDRSESVNLMTASPEYLAAHNYDPEMLRRKRDHLINLWFEEAGKNMVLPLDDRSAAEQAGVERPSEEPPRKVYTYYPGAAPVPESVAANVRGRSFTIAADVEITADSKGVIFAHGSRFGGHSLFVTRSRPAVLPATKEVSAPGEVFLCYAYNFLGIKPEQKFWAGPLAPGRYLFRVEFTKEGVGEHGESTGQTTLFVNNFHDNPLEKRKPVVTKAMRAQVGKFTLCGDGLCVGYDSADAVSEEYSGANPFEHGTIHKVVVIPGNETVIVPYKVLAGPYSAD